MLPHCVNNMVRIFIKCLIFECNCTTHLAGNCVRYGVQGTEFCADCGTLQQECNSSCYFCKDRRHHHLVSRYPYNDVDNPGRLRLLSVLCIETSHYVCFTRVQGSGRNEWVFFDSMDERPGRWLHML